MKAGSNILTPETTTNSMGSYRVASPTKTKTIFSCGNIMGTVSWNDQECKRVAFLPRNEIVNVVGSKLLRALRGRSPVKKHIILQYENACPHLKDWLESALPFSLQFKHGSVRAPLEAPALRN
jgi:hypothetical protein